MRYFVYCRKSSEAEDRQIASIESQLSTLRRTFADRSEVEIVHVFEEAFSAKSPGRPIFGEMIRAIEKGAAHGVIAWAPDRLARNSIDGGRIVYLLDTGVLKDLKFATYTFENNSQGKFMLQIMFGQSKYYSDALSENVKRGLRTRVEKGWHPTKPPLGYLNDPQTRTIVRDPESFHRVREMFEHFLTDRYSTPELWNIARNEWQLRTHRGKRSGGSLIPQSYIHKTLTNRFYAGIIEWNGQVYRGAHEPVVSMDEFERAQELRHRALRPRAHTIQFAYTGLMRCGECGFSITAEDKVNRHGKHYLYYHCTRRRHDYDCRQPSITATTLECQIERFLAELSLPERLHSWAVQVIALDDKVEEEAIEERRRTLHDAQERTKRALENLTSLRVRDVISDDEFLQERRTLETEQLRLEQQAQRERDTQNQFEPLESLVLFRNRAIEWFRNGDDEIKRTIVKIVGSNPVLKDKKLNIEAKEPFRQSFENGSEHEMRRWRTRIRKLMINEDQELQEVLRNIRMLERKNGVQSD
jgi:site-specific DNA recombinase